MTNLKPYKSFSEQIAILGDRGMVIDDVSSAEFYLSLRNYYRLNAYFHRFLKRDRYKRVSFNDIIAIEEADSRFRYLIFQRIESIELRLRTLVAYYSAQVFGPSAFQTGSCFRQDKVQMGVKLINTEHEKVFRNFHSYPEVKHHKHKYGKQMPTWVMVEYLSFGDLSKVYSYLDEPIQNNIATHFKIKPDLLESLAHSLSVVRNICAHHGYLFRRNLNIRPKINNQFLSILGSNRSGSGKIFDAILCIYELLLQNERATFIQDILQFENSLNHQENRIRQIHLSDYGFPANWQKVLKG